MVGHSSLLLFQMPGIDDIDASSVTLIYLSHNMQQTVLQCATGQIMSSLLLRVGCRFVNLEPRHAEWK